MRLAVQLTVVVGALAWSGCVGDRSNRVPGAPESAQLSAVVKLTATADGVVTRTLADGTSRVSWSPSSAGGALALGEAPNRAPIMSLKTTPPADGSTRPFPTILGSAPLLVRFNLCQSSDPDQSASGPEPGDSLNWQFNFGDGRTPAFAADGTFNPDYERFCRVEHTYDVGSYTATAVVTDKHANDQSAGLRAMARSTQQLTIMALGAPPPEACAFTTIDRSAWRATGSDVIPFSTCTCPSTGATVLTVGPYLDGCRATGFFGVVWELGGRCGCF